MMEVVTADGINLLQWAQENNVPGWPTLFRVKSAFPNREISRIYEWEIVIRKGTNSMPYMVVHIREGDFSPQQIFFKESGALKYVRDMLQKELDSCNEAIQSAMEKETVPF